MDCCESLLDACCLTRERLSFSSPGNVAGAGASATASQEVLAAVGTAVAIILGCAVVDPQTSSHLQQDSRVYIHLSEDSATDSAGCSAEQKYAWIRRLFSSVRVVGSHLLDRVQEDASRASGTEEKKRGDAVGREMDGRQEETRPVVVSVDSPARNFALTLAIESLVSDFAEDSGSRAAARSTPAPWRALQADYGKVISMIRQVLRSHGRSLLAQERMHQLLVDEREAEHTQLCRKILSRIPVDHDDHGSSTRSGADEEGARMPVEIVRSTAGTITSIAVSALDSSRLVYTAGAHICEINASSAIRFRRRDTNGGLVDCDAETWTASQRVYQRLEDEALDAALVAMSSAAGSAGGGVGNHSGGGGGGGGGGGARDEEQMQPRLRSWSRQYAPTVLVPSLQQMPSFEDLRFMGSWGRGGSKHQDQVDAHILESHPSLSLYVSAGPLGATLFEFEEEGSRGHFSTAQPVERMAFASDVLGCAHGGFVSLWRLSPRASQRPFASIPLHANIGMEFLGSSQLIAAATERVVQVHDVLVPSNKMVTAEASLVGITCLCWSGRDLLVGDSAGNVHTLDLRQRRVRAVASAPAAVTVVAVAGDGRILSGHTDGSVRVGEALVATHADAVTALRSGKGGGVLSAAGNKVFSLSGIPKNE